MRAQVSRGVLERSQAVRRSEASAHADQLHAQVLTGMRLSTTNVVCADVGAGGGPNSLQIVAGTFGHGYRRTFQIVRGRPPTLCLTSHSRTRAIGGWSQTLGRLPRQGIVVHSAPVLRQIRHWRPSWRWVDLSSSSGMSFRGGCCRIGPVCLCSACAMCVTILLADNSVLVSDRLLHALASSYTLVLCTRQVPMV